MKTWWIATLAIGGALALPIVGQEKGQDGKPPVEAPKVELLKLGSSVPEALAMKDLDGKSQTFKDLRGKVVIVHFWSDRCPAEVHADPVMKKLKRLSVPFIYDRQLYKESGADDVWEEQAMWGFSTGVAVGLHLPQDRHFLLGVDRTDALPEDDSRLTQLLAQLQLLAVHAQDAALRLMAAQPSQASDVRLTPRETEIMRMTMTGMTAIAIAEKLSISSTAVQFHLVNVRKKFNTNSKHQAVLRALALGLL